MIKRLNIKLLSHKIRNLEQLISNIIYKNEGRRFYSVSNLKYELILKKLRLDFMLHKTTDKEYVYNLLTFLSYEDRTEIIHRFCWGCGSDNPRCHCMNEE